MALMLPVFVTASLAQDVPKQGAVVDWEEIKRHAAEVVQADHTEAALPFARPSSAVLAASPRKVFIYYFPFFQISMDNQPIAQDHWTIDYMRRSGEGAKYAAAGGFTRERPLPAGPWQTSEWREINEAIDVLRAKAMGADGFGVGLQGVSTGTALQIPLGVAQAAAHVTNSFYVFAEPDGAVLKDVPSDGMAETVKAFNSTSATLRLPNGHALLAPFSPQTETVEYWRTVLARLDDLGNPSDFIPVLLNPWQFSASFAPISIGLSFWGFRDPARMSGSAGQNLMKIAHSTSPIWMQPVTSQDFRPKEAVFWESRNTELFRNAWMQAIEDGAQYVHLVTWNDYSEATEIGPSSGIQYLFYDLAAYYTVWFKMGKPPRIIRDAIYYAHRNQIFDPGRSLRTNDRPYSRLGDTPVYNDIEMIALLTSPATMEIEIDGHAQQRRATSGLNTFRVPAASGRPRFRILRNDQVVVEKLSDWVIDPHPDSSSALYFGGSSTRAFVMVPPASASTTR